jgi:hypothetical protein
MCSLKLMSFSTRKVNREEGLLVEKGLLKTTGGEVLKWISYHYLLTQHG